VADAQNMLGISSGLLFANPIPREAEIPKSEIDGIIEKAIQEADAAGASGKDNTPFILDKIKDLTGKRSVTSNRALVASNVQMGTFVAKELARLESDEPNAPPEDLSHTVSIP
jgi:pseudouridylate synthase / pseudouridine kinase